MLKPFEFLEHLEDDRIFDQYPNLRVSDSPAFYLILRGIIGSLQIKQTFKNSVFIQNVNFLKLDTAAGTQTTETVSAKNDNISEDLKTEIQSLIILIKKKCKPDLSVLIQYISDTFTLKDLSEVISNRSLVKRNRIFFESLNDELCNFYYNTYKQNHTVAFLHLYRVLEYISYSFPLMYATSTKDFAKSFDAFKNLFSDEKDSGELKVFKYFIKNVMSLEKDYERLSIDINIFSEVEEFNETVYKMLIRICNSEIFEEHRNVTNSKICIKFSEFSSFIITIRNRFFHLKNSQDNIQSKDIIDSDHFFSLINNECAYFLSLVIVHVIKKSYFQ